ncbi:helix-turn-helix transcriptional regulator [Mesorhizobium atlanticum]|uniref:DNA-binding protein n=1 Tax=Mesorhizobium atlanticum TaxID=2233532 RepID=A0A330GQ53_9HYPH|nr:DNA-binding protein [Mesorhizobium atlanticum]RAZ73036.1 DNA-binding protein [Mesorhizobium atlanticum]
MEYTFTLKYRLADDDQDADALVERLGEVGCTDAVVGIGIVGRLALEFTRDAGSAQEAVRSALADVKAAIPTATLIEATPDLVGLTDVAEMMGVSRQYLRKLMMGNNDFPAPVHEGNGALWHLSDVLGWLKGRKGYQPEHTLLETAKATLEVNVAKEARRFAPTAMRELERLIA